MYAAAALALLAAVARAELGANDVDVIKQNFDNAQLTSLVGTFNPEGLITARWPSNATLSIGKPVDPTTAREFPTLSINPAPGANDFNADSLYTALLVDAKQVGTNFTGATQTLHWLINNIHIDTTAQGGPYPLVYQNGTTVIQYAGPAPPQGDAAHRYVFLVFEQTPGFTPPEAYSRADQYPAPGDFDLPTYLADSKLAAGSAPLVGANYFTVEQPGATQTVPVTQTTNNTIAAPTDGVVAGGATAAGNGTAGAGGAAGNGTAGAAGNGTEGAGGAAAGNGTEGASGAAAGNGTEGAGGAAGGNGTEGGAGGASAGSGTSGASASASAPAASGNSGAGHMALPALGFTFVAAAVAALL